MTQIASRYNSVRDGLLDLDTAGNTVAVLPAALDRSRRIAMASARGPTALPPPPAKRRRAAPLPRAPHECAICFAALDDPVVTVCGHSFCRRCLAQYLQFAPTPAPAVPAASSAAPAAAPPTRPCPTCAAPLPQAASAYYPNDALRRILATITAGEAAAGLGAADTGGARRGCAGPSAAPSHPPSAVAAHAEPAAAETAASAAEAAAAEAALGREIALSFLARARRDRREARDHADRDLALIDADLAVIADAGAGLAVGLGLAEELAAEVRRAVGGGGGGGREGRGEVRGGGDNGRAATADGDDAGGGGGDDRAADQADSASTTTARVTRAGGRAAGATVRLSRRTRASKSAVGAEDFESEAENGSASLPQRKQGAARKSSHHPLPPAPPSPSPSPSVPPPPSVPLPSRAALAEVCSRTALIDRFHDDVQALYFERRTRLGVAGLDSVTSTLVRATSLSTAHRRATVRHVDILNSPASSLTSAVQFNTGARLFAAAGAAKRIKLYDFQSILVRSRGSNDRGNGGGLGGGDDDDDDLHCPVLEIPALSKLTSLSWSRKDEAVLAAGSFSGAITVHDTEANMTLHTFADHDARTWSVDFSAPQPTLLLSGSDDNTVRLWDVGRVSKPTLTLPTKASVCSVKFNPDASHELAYGSADHFVYSVDTRFPRTPICVFEGHWRAVSNVLFLNRSELISASTDSSCKLWKVREQEPGLSYGGHVNERNFVGLCGNADFFACGSEDCSIYVYHKSLTGPVVRYGLEAEGSFVSSVCWKPDSNYLVAANNIGSMEVVELC